MKKANSKRLLTLVLALVLVFALSVSAFATWSSFQGRNSNNGTISTQPATGTSPTVTPVQLAINDPGNMVYTGVDAASVIQGNYAFTLYNGGVSDGNLGGARMQATNMAAADPTIPFWNIQIDADASNGFHLSTPYYDSSNNVIYVAVSYADNAQNYHWRLYSISNVLTSTPTKSGVLASGDGQINTHINSVSYYLYFGGWGGEHAYYQYGPINGTASLKKFIADPQEDYYYAGASKFVDSDNNTNVVFGSESGKIYIRPIGDTFGTATGSVIDLATTQSTCGPIRSSICVVGSDWYLTSKGSGSSGYLWRIDNGATVNSPLALAGNSTSTPVVSNNGYVYVGYYVGFTDGGVIAVPLGFTSSTTQTSVYSGAPVQCSPIVYSITTGPDAAHKDFVYFTTNSETGSGYCYSMEQVSHNVSAVWTATGTGSNRYALQGFSSENGYLVYGNDGAKLYIVH